MCLYKGRKMHFPGFVNKVLDPMSQGDRFSSGLMYPPYFLCLIWVFHDPMVLVNDSSEAIENQPL